MFDAIIIGGGPAGVSAALTLRSRGKSVLLISVPAEHSPLYRAERIDNYPGLPGVSGKALLDALHAQLLASGAEYEPKRVLSVLPTGTKYFVSFDNEVRGARSLILACGVSSGAKLPGEAEYLGRGVSWCATCDGMLYRGRSVIVAGDAPDAAEEAGYLSGIGCRVTYVAPQEPEAALTPGVSFVKAKQLSVYGAEKAQGLIADGRQLPADCVFLLHKTVAPGDFLPGLAVEGGHVKTDALLHTNLPGVFAAGDCAGAPHQIAKAVGEGQLAAFEAMKVM